MLTVVYPVIKVPSGNKNYSARIIKGLRKRNYKFKDIGIRKVEFSLFGKPVGGILSQRLQLGFHSFKEHPVHALVPEVAPKECDIVTVHDVIPLKKNDSFISSVYDRRAYEMMYSNARNAKILISSTKLGIKEISENLNVEEGRIRVVYESIDHEIFFPDDRNPYENDGKYHLVTVGDFNPRKRFDILYNIYGGKEDFELYHIGPINSWKAYYERDKLIASKFKNIHILGAQPSESLRRYLSNADLFVYYSEAEGFGLTPIEAMATGTNVLVNDLPVFHETLGNIAFFADQEDYLETTYKALNSKRSRDELVKFSMRYSLDQEIGNLINIYQEFQND